MVVTFIFCDLCLGGSQFGLPVVSTQVCGRWDVCKEGLPLLWYLVLLRPLILVRVMCDPSRGQQELRLCWGPGFTQPSFPCVPSHTVNLLGNLPLKCLDVLLTLEPHEGSLEFLGVNMDVIHALLSFLEKRLHQVGRRPCYGSGPGFPRQLWALLLCSLHW